MDTSHTSLSTIWESEVEIPCLGVELQGSLSIPTGTSGLVIFAHGSGSSRMSPRNRMVASGLHHSGLATLQFDLLTPMEAQDEAATGALRFNIPFLTERLVAATQWARQHEELKRLGLGYFGSSTGAAAALCAAAEVPDVQAVVSRGGRTDLADEAVEGVHAATLLIVGELDPPVLAWNHATLQRLPGLKHLSVVSGATHLFHEHGALERVTALAATWFKLHLMEPTP